MAIKKKMRASKEKYRKNNNCKNKRAGYKKKNMDTETINGKTCVWKAGSDCREGERGEESRSVETQEV